MGTENDFSAKYSFVKEFTDRNPEYYIEVMHDFRYILRSYFRYARVITASFTQAEAQFTPHLKCPEVVRVDFIKTATNMFLSRHKTFKYKGEITWLG